MTTGVKQKWHRVSVKCRVCHGLDYVEYEAGLIRLPCRRCRGTGRVIKLKIVKGEKKNGNKVPA